MPTGGRCSGPCVVDSARQEYADQVREVVWFLRGRTKPLIQSMERRMARAAEVLEYERAARLRDDVSVIRGAPNTPSLSRCSVWIFSVSRALARARRLGDRFAHA